MFMGCKVIITSGGESTAGIDSLPEDPMCTLSTEFVLTRASQTGFQYGSWKLGYPRAAGFSEKVNECTPFFEQRRTSAAHSSASQMTGSAIGMKRPE